MEFHPIAGMFPLMDAAEIAALAADVRKRGLQEAIWLHQDGRIVDGRNRYLACQQIGVVPATRVYAGDDASLSGFVISLNLVRRHLNESQRAMIAARIATLQSGQRADFAAKSTAAGQPAAVPQAAQLVGVSRDSVTQARTVLSRGTPDEVKAVEAGRLPVSPLADAIRRGEPPEQRKRLLDGMRDHRGRRMPVKPVAGMIERGIDQLDTAVTLLGELLARSETENHDTEAWVKKLEDTRTRISRIIRQHRKTKES